MGPLKIPREKSNDSVLLVDDEPEHLDWLVSFLEAQGLSVCVATNVEEAMREAEKKYHWVYIIDLNIPWGGWVISKNLAYENYPGLAIIEAVRTQGNVGSKVIAYSAHINTVIDSEIKRLYSEYIAKGRPIQLKDRLHALLKNRGKSKS